MEASDVKISVLLPAYNAEKYLREAVDSILNQTFTDFELLIVNDGSTDSTEEIILSYSDSRIRYEKNDGNHGLIYTLNRGLTLCKGKYIARMDSDDIALPDRFQAQFDYMEQNPETGVCGTNIEVFYDDAPQCFTKVWFPESDREVRAYTYFQAAFCHPSVMLRKSVLDANNIDYPNYLRAEDYALWIELLPFTKMHNLQSVHLRYRKWAGSESWLLSNKDKAAVSVANRLQDIYFRRNGIVMEMDDIIALGSFVNRSAYYSLSKDSQKTADKALNDFFAQLKRQDADSAAVAKDYVSTACFYRFVKNRKFPAFWGLIRLFFFGMYSFSKKMPTFVRRKMNNK
ncbi:MAG: glycosyltransferase [Dysgonamonadaceae bacterium]|nr:glycosyltransferase [Dysgonamonadaceae bacterium]